MIRVSTEAYIMKVERWLSKLYHRAMAWIRYRVFFSKAAFFISGLVFSHALTEYAVTALLIDYLTSTWKVYHLARSAAIVNIYDTVSATSAIVMAYISDAYIGGFMMVLLSNAVYLTGFALLWLFSGDLAPKERSEIAYTALTLMAFGKAGREPPLKAFFADQFRNRRPNLEVDEEEEEEQVEARRKVYWRVAWFMGTTVAVIFLASPDQWPKKFKVSTIAVGVSFLLFLCGTSFYNGKIKISIGSKLRYVFLHKADIISDERERVRNLYTVAVVKELKTLLKMVPLWLNFFGYSLVVAAGSTYFYEQSSNMNTKLGNSFTIQLSYFSVIGSTSNFIITLLVDSFIPKKWTEARKRQATRVSIAIGLLISIICCVIASLVEAHRLKLVHDQLNDETSESETIPMSALWLAPQFCLLGITQALAQTGMRAFFYKIVAKSMRRYGLPFNNCVTGIGGCLSMLIVQMCRGWFGQTINDSRLDHYYVLLAVICSFNLCLYWFVSSKYIYNEAEEAEAEEEEEEEAEARQDVELSLMVEDNLTSASLGKSLFSRSQHHHHGSYRDKKGQVLFKRSKTFS